MRTLRSWVPTGVVARRAGTPMFSKPTWPNVRDGILFFAGLAGLAYEVLVRRPPDYGFVPVFGGMIGLPAFLKRDSQAKAPHNGEDPNDNALSGG